MKQCFIVCPIGSDESETRKRSDTLLNYVLKPICEECGFNAVRVDELNTGDSITNKIIDYLINSDLVIADLTGHNPNVFYELGYRTALGKPTIQIKSKDETLPFDVNTIQTFDYNINDIPAIEVFKSRIKQTILSFNFVSNVDATSTSGAESNFNSVILQELYAMHDMLNGISKKLSETNTSAISVLADKLSQANVKTPEIAFIETLLPTLIKNPESLKTIMELSQASKK